MTWQLLGHLIVLLHHDEWILLRFWTWKSTLSQSASPGNWETKEWRAGGESGDAKTLNKWEEDEWGFQIQTERLKQRCKPFRKRWPPTPCTPTATSPCLPGSIDPLIRYSQSPLLGRPPPQFSVRDGMWGCAPLRITIPVIFCYNIASHFSSGWVEMIWDGKGEEGWLIPSPSLIPPTFHEDVCIPVEGVIQPGQCSDFRIDALIPTTWKTSLFLLDTSPLKKRKSFLSASLRRYQHLHTMAASKGRGAVLAGAIIYRHSCRNGNTDEHGRGSPTHMGEDQ